tara:strand:+ start:2521 stop:2778 length:258 start_codon:yes stop_codon:yes gene_type:complete
MKKKLSFIKKEKILIDLLIEKVGKPKFKKIKKNENILKSGVIDSLDFADIYSFIEKKFKVKIPFFRIFGKNSNVTVTNLKKCLKL